MLYLVGGCGRSGKSSLAERMRVRHGVPWFPLDALKMGLHLGAASLGVCPDDDDLETADRMWPIVKGALENLVFDGRDYLVEGVNLRPATVTDFARESETPVRTCFLGYPEVSVEAKAAQVARHVRRYVDYGRSQSRRLRDECRALGIPFFDTGVDFEGALASAEHALIQSPVVGLPRFAIGGEA
jgi:hypothetical protein